jgi:hypothetical protein
VDQQLYKQHGEYKVFYSAFNSSFIDPDIAVANDIVRGKDKGLVNIAVAKVPGVALPAVVSGTVSNIIQQSQTLEFVAVREQNTVYYLAPFEFDNEDFLTFKIRVVPQSDGPETVYPYDFKFQKKMYVD